VDKGIIYNCRDDPAWQPWHADMYGAQGGIEDTSSSSESEDESEPVTLPSTCVCKNCRYALEEGGYHCMDQNGQLHKCYLSLINME
jgi:hypothetical protein